MGITRDLTRAPAGGLGADVMGRASILGVESVPATPYAVVAGSLWAGGSSVTRNGETGTPGFLVMPNSIVGRSYRVSFTLAGLSGDTFTVSLGGANVGNITTNGNKAFTIVGGGDKLVLIPWGGSAGQATITAISIRLIQS